MPHRVAIVVSHPIQHFVSFYRALAADPQIQLTVIFCSRIGLEPYFDHAMNTMIAWKMDLLGGYDHVFLPEAESITRTGPLEVDNPSVTDELDRIAPDAVVIYGYIFKTSRRVLKWSCKTGTPALMISDSELKTRRAGWKEAVKRLVVPRLLRRVAAFLTVGDCNEDYYRHYGVPEERLFRSPFTIDEETYLAARANKAELRARIRAELSIADYEIVALAVGKLSARKRPGDVVEALRIARRNAPDLPIRVVFAGNGAEMARLKADVAAEDLPVNFAGFVNVDRLPGYYAAADMIVHASSRDPHPLVMSEGACIGLPLLISSRVGAAGPTDIARPGENAQLFMVDDPPALASALIALAGDRDLRVAMGARSIEIFDELNMARSVTGAKAALEFVQGQGVGC